MEPILSCCGYRCDLCLAYRPNIEANPTHRQTLSDGWFHYFGFRLPPEEICCDGCLAEDAHRIDRTCPVRPCVLANGLENCAGCDEYVCAKIAERLVTYEEVRQRAGAEIPFEDYRRFIQPYENRLRLAALRRQPR